MKNIKTAEILCVGTELLLGDIVNTNAAFLSQRLAELGISVYRHTSVGDNPRRLSLALEAALGEADLVITSGGLGPTYDDLTKETVAGFFCRPMELHEESLERIKSYFARTGRVMTKNNEKQAMMPVGAHVFRNDYGTAPALALYDEKTNKTVIMLPGPPRELMPLFNGEVASYLEARTSDTLVSKNVNIFGIGESAVEDKIRDLMTGSENPTVAPYCKEGEVRLRVTAKAGTKREATELCDAMIERITQTEVGDYVYGIDAETLEGSVVSFFRENGLTLSAAESCTGGLISEMITSVSGSSSVFFGGCVTYTNGVKSELLGVSREILAECGAVSAEVAVEMARNVRLKLGTDVGVSATGLAGPEGDGSGLPVGTVFIGVSTKLGDDVRRLSLSSMRSRDYIRTVSAKNALDMAKTAAQNMMKN